MMGLPEKFARGILNSNFIDNEGQPSIQLFVFEDKSLNTISNNLELSINLLSDVDAITQLLNETSTKYLGDLLYKEGVVVLSTECFHLMSAFPNNRKYGLAIKEDALPNNQYHGNLLMKSGVSKPIRMKIAYAIFQNCFLDYINGRNLTTD